MSGATFPSPGAGGPEREPGTPAAPGWESFRRSKRPGRGRGGPGTDPARWPALGEGPLGRAGTEDSRWRSGLARSTSPGARDSHLGPRSSAGWARAPGGRPSRRVPGRFREEQQKTLPEVRSCSRRPPGVGAARSFGPGAAAGGISGVRLRPWRSCRPAAAPGTVTVAQHPAIPAAARPVVPGDQGSSGSRVAAPGSQSGHSSFLLGARGRLGGPGGSGRHPRPRATEALCPPTSTFPPWIPSRTPLASGNGVAQPRPRGSQVGREGTGSACECV